MKKNKCVAIDFDGTIARYDGWKGKGIFGEPIPGAIEAIENLKEKGWVIIIFTTRSEVEDVEEYLNLYGIQFDYINHNPENEKLNCSNKKPLADVYIDDRAISFAGNWDKTLNEISNFKEWWKK